MKHFRFLSIAGAALLLLSGCAANVETASVEGLEAKGSAFQNALHKEYVELALMEKNEGDEEDTVYFIEKAKKAGMGEEVGPQPLTEREIPADGKQDLANARVNLVNKLWEGAADITPGAAARAQAMFDCWMQEKEENFQPKDIERCRSEFDKAYAQLATPVAKKPEPKMEKKMPPPPPLPSPYTVYFDTDSADVDDAGMVVIKQAYADYRLHKPGKVWIAGHTDTRGSKAYNMGLSRYRSNEVGNRLMELGVSRKVVEKARHGEDAPAVNSGDNKDERMNRRVSIVFMR